MNPSTRYAYGEDDPFEDLHRRLTRIWHDEENNESSKHPPQEDVQTVLLRLKRNTRARAERERAFEPDLNTEPDHNKETDINDPARTDTQGVAGESSVRHSTFGDLVDAPGPNVVDPPAPTNEPRSSAPSVGPAPVDPAPGYASAPDPSTIIDLRGTDTRTKPRPHRRSDSEGPSLLLGILALGVMIIVLYLVARGLI